VNVPVPSAGDVTVWVDLADADDEQVGREADILRSQLLRLDVESVRRFTDGPAPSGTRAVDAATVGALVVTVGQVAGALGSLVGMVRDWIAHRSDRSIRLEIDGDVIQIDAATLEQRQQLIDTWVRRHEVR
jgi:hypothetical protein